MTGEMRRKGRGKESAVINTNREKKVRGRWKGGRERAG